MVEQDGVDALHPAGVLIPQILEQLQQTPYLQHLLRCDPRLGQPPRGQQLAQLPGVGPVGLGPPLRSTCRRGLGRLR